MTNSIQLSTRKLSHNYILSSFLFFLFMLLLFSNHANSAQLQNAESLIKTIRQGGYVLYLRHAASNRKQIDIDTVNLDDCSKQRNLSDKGRQQAKAIGKAIKSLNIPIGDVTTSPYCRCVDTAQLAFGRSIKSDDLRFTISANESETRRLSDALKNLLSSVPKTGTNTVIVAHTGNLKEAANVWPKPEGVLHVFKPLGKNRFEHLGKITPNQWNTLK